MYDKRGEDLKQKSYESKSSEINNINSKKKEFFLVLYDDLD